MKNKISIYLLLLLPLVLISACEDDEDGENNTDNTDLSIEIRKSDDFGNYLSTSEGKTLYIFARDVAGESECGDACLSTWEPVGVSTKLPLGFSDEFGLLRRDDGFVQLSFKGWPLYIFSGEDANEISADNKDDAWYVAKPDYSLFIGIKTIENQERTYLIDEQGRSVYYKSDDGINQSSCLTAACMLRYPPLQLSASIFPSILDSTQISVIGRSDSLPQSGYKNRPLYFHSLDNRGEATGQGFLGVWFVMEDSFF